MRRVLLLDNYDSFTYNLVHYLTSLDMEVVVRRNDASIDDCLEFDYIVLSPGPGLPSEAGNMPALIKMVDGKIPLLGVCLGMQGIAEYLGGSLYNQEVVQHGVSDRMSVTSSYLFTHMDAVQEVGLYHSWAVLKEPAGDFEITAVSSKGIVMAIENHARKLYGVQFHPESIMTPNGLQMLKNFLYTA